MSKDSKSIGLAQEKRVSWSSKISSESRVVDIRPLLIFLLIKVTMSSCPNSSTLPSKEVWIFLLLWQILRVKTMNKWKRNLPKHFFIWKDKVLKESSLELAFAGVFGGLSGCLLNSTVSRQLLDLILLLVLKVHLEVLMSSLQNKFKARLISCQLETILITWRKKDKLLSYLLSVSELKKLEQLNSQICFTDGPLEEISRWKRCQEMYTRLSILSKNTSSNSND